MKNLEFIENYYLPSGRVFLFRTDDGYFIESTEMQDVTLDGKMHEEVRNTQDPRIIWNHLVPRTEKWLMTVSTQKGCMHNCKFCDVAPLKFGGNLTEEEIVNQFDFMLKYTPKIEGKSYKKLKLGFARMGEPAWNIDNVLRAMRAINAICFEERIKLLPCFNSIIPNTVSYSSEEIIQKVIDIKENYFNGFLHFQISANSTDENVRHKLFNTKNVETLENIIKIINKEKITNRTVTLNFIVMKGVPIVIDDLKKMGLNKEKFAVKLIPLNFTDNSKENNLDTKYNYSSYDELKMYADEFKKEGIPVIYDAIAKCEEAGLCCGQLAKANYYNKR